MLFEIGDWFFSSFRGDEWTRAKGGVFYSCHECERKEKKKKKNFGFCTFYSTSENQTLIVSIYTYNSKDSYNSNRVALVTEVSSL